MQVYLDIQSAEPQPHRNSSRNHIGFNRFSSTCDEDNDKKVWKQEESLSSCRKTFKGIFRSKLVIASWENLSICKFWRIGDINFLQTILHQEQDNWNRILSSSLHKYSTFQLCFFDVCMYNVQFCIHRILALALRKYLLERGIIMHMKWNEASYWILKMPLKITLTISDLVENKWALHMD